MKTRPIIAMLAGLFGLAGTGLAAEAVDPNRLEPCINGEVSASGLYPTQAEEDAARAEGTFVGRTLRGQMSANGR